MEGRLAAGLVREQVQQVPLRHHRGEALGQAEVVAVRAVAAERRTRDLAAGTLIASVCPGMVGTATYRPWFGDHSEARSPADAARAVLDLVLADDVDPARYGELVRFGGVLPWHDGTPPVEQDRMLTR